MTSTADTWCLYCGSESNVDVKKIASENKKRNLDPELKVLGTGGSIGSLGNERVNTIESSRKQCLSCLNLYYSKKVLKPLQIVKKKEIIVIPQSLWVILNTENYEKEEQIIDFVDKHYDKIKGHYNKFMKNGRNKCKSNRIGYKLRLSFSMFHYVICWVIVEVSESNVLYRLCYGGGKVNCRDY